MAVEILERCKKGSQKNLFSLIGPAIKKRTFLRLPLGPTSAGGLLHHNTVGAAS